MKVIQKGAAVVTKGVITELFVVPGSVEGRPTLQVVLDIPDVGSRISYLHTTGGALAVTQRILRALKATSTDIVALRKDLVGQTVTVRIAEQVQVADDGTETPAAADVSIRTSDEDAEKALSALGLAA